MQPLDLGAVEVIDVGRGPRLSARGRRALVAALAVLCLAGVVAWRVDARSRDQDARAVATCGEVALKADLKAFNTEAFMVREVDQVLDKVGEGPRRDGLLGLVAEAAARALPGVNRALTVCRRTRVTWPHHDLAQRRDSYVDYLAARVRRLEEVAADGAAYYDGQPRLDELRAEAFGT